MEGLALTFDDLTTEEQAPILNYVNSEEYQLLSDNRLFTDTMIAIYATLVETAILAHNITSGLLDYEQEMVARDETVYFCENLLRLNEKLEKLNNEREEKL